MQFEKQVSSILERLISLPAVDETAANVIDDIHQILASINERELLPARGATSSREATEALAHIAALCCLGAEYIRQTNSKRTHAIRKTE